VTGVQTCALPIYRLASHAAFSASEQLARGLGPSTDPDEIARWQSETTEARALLDQHPETTIGGARDVRPLTQNARLGAMLSPLDLLEIRQTLLAGQTLHRTLARLSALYPRLAARAAQIQESPILVGAIARAVNDRGEILDGASEALARIRRELNLTRSRLQDKLQKIITSSTHVRFLQEGIITQRDGRYVVPIRAEAKGKIPGIVHDTSASGATLFIEPLSTVEMGNRVVELARAEEREIERILRELTSLVGAHADSIDETVETLAEIDLALAKAKY
jgi:DNA mismatch repair protein MutS2